MFAAVSWRGAEHGSTGTSLSHRLRSVPVPPGLTEYGIADDSKNWPSGRSNAREKMRFQSHVMAFRTLILLLVPTGPIRGPMF